MPRIALVCLCVVGGCSFEPDYRAGALRCTDQICPTGLVCEKNLDDDDYCREPRRDAAVDGPGDGDLGDAPKPHGMNCADPQPLVSGMDYKDSTAMRSSKIGAQCVIGIMNGNDAVHVIEPGAGKQMLIDVQATWSAYAYVISVCNTTGMTSTTCNGTTYARPGEPTTLTALAGKNYIVVDGLYPIDSGAYTLTVTVQ